MAKRILAQQITGQKMCTTFPIPILTNSSNAVNGDLATLCPVRPVWFGMPQHTPALLKIGTLPITQVIKISLTKIFLHISVNTVTNNIFTITFNFYRNRLL